MWAALNTLAVVDPDWLQKNTQPQWIERYGRRVEDSRLPESKEQRDMYVRQVGTDGHLLSPLQVVRLLMGLPLSLFMNR